MINRSQLMFHDTFQPEAPYLTKILDLASIAYVGKKEDISSQTGIPTGKQRGKVEPHIKYATYMGLVSHKVEKGAYYLSLTQLGQEIYNQDKYLHERLTRWLCHYGITRLRDGAPQWEYLVHTGHTGFTQINSIEWHLKRANTMFGTNIDAEELFGVTKRSYNEGFFSDLNYVKWSDGIEYVEHLSNQEMLFVYAYAILDSWERIFPEKREITITELNEELGFGKAFNLCDDEIDNILVDLENQGIIKTNRLLFPKTIVATGDSVSIIPFLYEFLL